MLYRLPCVAFDYIAPCYKTAVKIYFADWSRLYARGRHITAKAASTKTISAFSVISIADMIISDVPSFSTKYIYIYIIIVYFVHLDLLCTSVKARYNKSTCQKYALCVLNPGCYTIFYNSSLDICLRLDCVFFRQFKIASYLIIIP